MRYIKKLIALIFWIFIYIPTSIFVFFVFIKNLIVKAK